MTHYLLSLPHDSATEPTMATMDPAELEATMAVAGAFIEELTASGAFVYGAGLHPPSTAVTVDATGDVVKRENEPFVRAEEYLGGFWVIEAADQETALGWAEKASAALGGRIEVRAVQEAPGQ